jgi:hypothetical protein
MVLMMGRTWALSHIALFPIAFRASQEQNKLTSLFYRVNKKDQAEESQGETT